MSDAFDLSKLNIFGDDLKLKQVFLDVTHPVGSVYVQYPRQKNPNELFNKTGEYSSVWEMQNYDGAFFRSYGTNADPFKNETDALVVQSQSTELPNHNHGVTQTPHSHTLSNELGVSCSETTNLTGEWCPETNKVAPVYDASGIYAGSWQTGRFQKGGTFQTTYVAPIAGATGQGVFGNAAYTLKFDANHSHTVKLTGSISAKEDNANISVDDKSISVETRPKNYTVIVWKRTN